MIMCGIVISQLDRMGETKLSRPTVMAAGHSPFVSSHIVCENSQCAPDKAHNAIGVPAGTAPLDLVKSAKQANHEFGIGVCSG
jgi:hypothetical protein